jgi:hypothetical protein
VLDRIERTSQEMELAGAPLPEERVTTLDDELTAARPRDARCSVPGWQYSARLPPALTDFRLSGARTRDRSVSWW